MPELLEVKSPSTSTDQCSRCGAQLAVLSGIVVRGFELGEVVREWDPQSGNVSASYLEQGPDKKPTARALKGTFWGCGTCRQPVPLDHPRQVKLDQEWREYEAREKAERERRAKAEREWLAKSNRVLDRKELLPENRQKLTGQFPLVRPGFTVPYRDQFGGLSFALSFGEKHQPREAIQARDAAVREANLRPVRQRLEQFKSSDLYKNVLQLHNQRTHAEGRVKTLQAAANTAKADLEATLAKGKGPVLAEGKVTGTAEELATAETSRDVVAKLYQEAWQAALERWKEIEREELAIQKERAQSIIAVIEASDPWQVSSLLADWLFAYLRFWDLGIGKLAGFVKLPEPAPVT